MPNRFPSLHGGPLIDEFREMRRQMVFDAMLQHMLQQVGPLAEAGLPGLSAPSMDLTQVGQLLGAARAVRRMSLRKLAAETGSDNTTIGRIERGQANPTIGTLQRLAKALGKQLRVSLVDEPKEQPTAKPQQGLLGVNGECRGAARPDATKTPEQIAQELIWNSLFEKMAEPVEFPPLPSVDELLEESP